MRQKEVKHQLGMNGKSCVSSDINDQTRHQTFINCARYCEAWTHLLMRELVKFQEIDLRKERVSGK